MATPKRARHDEMAVKYFPKFSLKSAYSQGLLFIPTQYTEFNFLNIAYSEKYSDEIFRKEAQNVVFTGFLQLFFTIIIFFITQFLFF
jgi:hypothetical protein